LTTECNVVGMRDANNLGSSENGIQSNKSQLLSPTKNYIQTGNLAYFKIQGRCMYSQKYERSGMGRGGMQ